MTEQGQIKIVGQNGAVSVVDYPFRHNAANFDYQLGQRMIELHDVDDEDETTPAEASRRIIRRPTPKDVANLR